MVDILLPYHLYKAVRFAIKQSKKAYKDKFSRHEFVQSLEALLDRHCARGNLTRSASEPRTWKMTDEGTRVVLDIYEDIRLASIQLQLPSDQFAALGLNSKVEIAREEPDSNRFGVRQRIGENWPEATKDRLLLDKEMNPFLTQKLQKSFHFGRYALGLYKRVECSDQFLDLFIVRLLGLVQLCGITRVTLEDLLEVAVHSPFYEKIARNHLSLIVGNQHWSYFTNMALDPFRQYPIGSTQYVHSKFADKATALSGDRINIGYISGGQFLTHGGFLSSRHQNLEFSIDRSAKVQEGEQVSMLSGWVNLLSVRPDIDSGPVVLHYDLHGNPMWTAPSVPTFQVRIKRTSHGLLVGKPRWPIIKPASALGQGIYGKPCSCDSPRKERFLGTSKHKILKGIRLKYCYTTEDIGDQVNLRYLEGMRELNFDELYILWAAGDLSQQLLYADWFGYATYVQVRNECFFCAIDRAFGTGCTILVAGGLV